jgi:hypothetical protein
MTNEIVASIRCESDGLVVERQGRPARHFKAELADVFFEPGEPRTRRIFVRDRLGRVTGFVDRREARDLQWTKMPASPQALQPDTTQTASQGMHGFDFEYGTWQVHHRVKSAANGGVWKEFDGTCTTRAFMAGQGDIEEHVFFRPTGNTYGTAMRAFDPKTGEWAIWWIDSRYPHFPLDPPAKGRFENGVGTFYSDSVVNGKTVRARLMWSHMTPASAHWEQASSDDGGKTWDTNWIMEFAR